MGRRVRQIIGFSLVVLLVLIWPLMFAYADWLRFSSPHAPDPQTGQVVYLKAARGVFYITREQERLVGPVSMFLVFFLGFGGMLLLGLDRQKNEASAPMWLLVLGWVLAGYWILMLAAPDQAMALLFTGSFTPPVDAHQFEPTVVPNH